MDIIHQIKSYRALKVYFDILIYEFQFINNHVVSIRFGKPLPSKNWVQFFQTLNFKAIFSHYHK